MKTELQSLLKNKNYKLLWASQILSQITINIMNFILLIRLFEKTESTIATSLLWVAYALPGIFFGAIGAVSVDIFDRRKMLMITNLLQAVVIFTYSFFHTQKPFLLYGVVMGYSLLNQFYVPAEAAALPSLVKEKQLANANGFFFMTQQISVVLGFVIAGFLYKYLGMTNSLYLCSVFLFLAFVSVSFLPALKVNVKTTEYIENDFASFFERIADGYRFIKGNRAILVPFLLLLGFQVGLAIATVNIPVIATDLFRVGIETSGLVVVAPAGVGAVIATLIIPRLINLGWRKRKIIVYSLGLLALCLTMLVIAGYIGNAYIRLTLSLSMITLIGLSIVGVVIPSQTYMQQATPDGMRGRVFGNFWFLAAVVGVFPVIFSGTITEILSVRVLLLLMAGCAMVALFFSNRINVGSLKIKGR